MHVNTKPGKILNEGEYNYVERCNLKARAHTCESHVVTYRKQRVRSPPTRLRSRLKLRKDRAGRCIRSTLTLVILHMH